MLSNDSKLKIRDNKTAIILRTTQENPKNHGKSRKILRHNNLKGRDEN